jgi:hypothetical protein
MFVYRMRATLLVRSREERIATITTNIRQYYTTGPQTPVV